MRHPARISSLLVAAMAALVAFAAMPQAAEEDILAADQGEIPVELNQGRMVRLPVAASAVAIADPNIADVQVVSARTLFIRGKKIGETSLYAMDAADNPVFNASVHVTYNIIKLDRMVRELSPDSDVNFRSVDGGLVMDGFAPTVAEAENIRNMASAFVGEKDKMVNLIQTAGSDQVTLQVKIVEMQRTDAKRFGINMQNAFDVGGLNLQLLQGDDIEIDTTGVLNGTISEVDRTGLLDRGGGTSTQLLGRWGRNGRMTSLIDALETQGLLHVLAEPSLTTTSGKPASFLAGGEFPIVVDAGNNAISVQYKPFGVSLNFTPVVMSKDRISIQVAPEVSTINFDNPIEVNGIKNPILLTRKASATVELGSGQTFALAGLLKSDASNSIARFPGLGEMPIIGALFRSHEFQNNQTELVILVTPYIVRPVSEHKAQTPLTGFKQPTDAQRILFGQLYQQEKMDPVVSPQEATLAEPLPSPADAPAKVTAPAPVMENKASKADMDMPALFGAGGFILP